MRGTPETWAKLPPLKDPMANLALELDSAMHRAVRQGLERKRIVIDPGLGFGKRKEQNSEILGRLDELASLDLPIMVGASRKHFLAREVALDTEFRLRRSDRGCRAVRRAHRAGSRGEGDEGGRGSGRRNRTRAGGAGSRAAGGVEEREEGSRLGGRSERPSAGGPREAVRPPGSRPAGGKSPASGIQV